MLLKQAPSQHFQGTVALEETPLKPQATVAVLLSSVSDCNWGCTDPLITDPNKTLNIILIKIVSWQTGDIGKLCIVSKDFIEYL